MKILDTTYIINNSKIANKYTLIFPKVLYIIFNNKIYKAKRNGCPPILYETAIDIDYRTVCSYNIGKENKCLADNSNGITLVDNCFISLYSCIKTYIIQNILNYITKIVYKSKMIKEIIIK